MADGISLGPVSVGDRFVRCGLNAACYAELDRQAAATAQRSQANQLAVEKERTKQVELQLQAQKAQVAQLVALTQAQQKAAASTQAAFSANPLVKLASAKVSLGGHELPVYMIGGAALGLLLLFALLG